MDSPKDKDWELLDSQRGEDLGLFAARYDWMKNPRNGSRLKALILESPDWVDIVAVTPEGKIVVVYQYRFGIGEHTTEIPAGLMEQDETPGEAARRELREETGYTARDWKYLGWVQANPAFMDNLCHQWLALDAIKTDMVELDAGEDVGIRELTVDEVYQEIKAGRMRNTYTLLALAQVFDLRGMLDVLHEQVTE